MTREFVQMIDIRTGHTTVTGAETTVYLASDSAGLPTGIPGGTLGSNNSLRLMTQATATLDIGAILTVTMKYGASVEASCTFQIDDTPVTNSPLMIEARLSADGGAGLQTAHISGAFGVPPENMIGVPVGYDTGTEASAGDIDLELTFTISGTGSATCIYTTLEKMSFVEGAVIPEVTLPSTMILTVSKLNRFSHILFKDITFYGEFEHHLDFLGLGTATITRSGSANATWRDGAAHAVAANLPRFEYSGETSLGLLINSGVGGESLTITSANSLHDANTLLWLQNNVLKTTPAITNPFNSGGAWIGTDNIHIKHVLKFNRVLTATELAIASNILSNPP